MSQKGRTTKQLKNAKKQRKGELKLIISKLYRRKILRLYKKTYKFSNYRIFKLSNPQIS